MTKTMWWGVAALAAVFVVGACSSDAPPAASAAAGQQEPTTAPATSEPAPLPANTATEQADASEAPPSTANDAPAPVAESGAATPAGFLATIGGAIYQTEVHECFELGDGAVAVSGEGSGPSGPFQFFMQAGLEEEISFQAGEFVVFSLPTDSDLNFQVRETMVRGQVTLAPDKVLVIEGECEPVAAAAETIPGLDAATLDDVTDGMAAAIDGQTYVANSYGCAATASGVAITGTGISDDGTFFTLYVESGRDVVSISVDGVHSFASGFTGQGTVDITRDGDRLSADAVALDGKTFAVVATVCEGL